MEYIFVSFKSRTHTIDFASYIKGYGIEFSIINTPKEAGIGCGLSIKLDALYLEKIKYLLSIKRPNSFVGIFLAKTIGKKLFIKSI